MSDFIDGFISPIQSIKDGVDGRERIDVVDLTIPSSSSEVVELDNYTDLDTVKELYYNRSKIDSSKYSVYVVDSSVGEIEIVNDTDSELVIDSIIYSYDSVYGEGIFGDVNFKRKSYPFMLILPDTFDYSDNGNFISTVALNFYHEKSFSDSKYVENIELVLELVESALIGLLGDGYVGDISIDSINNFAGEVEGRRVEEISVILNYEIVLDYTDIFGKRI